MSVAAFPPLLLQFTATVVLAFVLGLELHGYRRAQDEGVGFGTTRTLTLIGATGFVLWLLDGPAPRGLFLAGFLVLAGWLSLDQWRVRPGEMQAGGALLPALVAMIAYALGPLVVTAPEWVVAAVVIVVILMMAEKPVIRRFSDEFPLGEGATLAKFLILAGLVLPLMPAKPLPGVATLTYEKVWMAVVALSGLSYLGYLAHRYFFPRADSVLTGFFGGLYSSTAATVVLARQARREPGAARQAPAAVVLASLTMYLRLTVLILVLGHAETARSLAAPFAVMVAGSAIVAGWLWRAGGGAPSAGAASGPAQEPRNPLDLPIALLFAGLFVAFAAITQWVAAAWGATGLRVMSALIGFTDIDPFILSLLAGHGSIPAPLTTGAILIATGSNNLLKAGYAIFLSRQPAMRPAAAWLVATTLLSVAWSAWLS